MYSIASSKILVRLKYKYFHTHTPNSRTFDVHIYLCFNIFSWTSLQLPDSLNPREIHVKAENNGEINVFLCHDTSPENSPNFGQTAQRQAVAAMAHHDPLIDDLGRLTPLMEAEKRRRLGK